MKEEKQKTTSHGNQKSSHHLLNAVNLRQKKCTPKLFRAINSSADCADLVTQIGDKSVLHYGDGSTLNQKKIDHENRRMNKRTFSTIKTSDLRYHQPWHQVTATRERRCVLPTTASVHLVVLRLPVNTLLGMSRYNILVVGPQLCSLLNQKLLVETGKFFWWQRSFLGYHKKGGEGARISMKHDNAWTTIHTKKGSSQLQKKQKS